MSGNPQIIYTVVVRGSNVVLSEYSTASGNYIQFVKTIISKVNASNVKKSFNYDQYEFHILVDSNYSFLVMSERGYKMRIAFACLEDLKNSFFKEFPPTARDGAIAYGLNDQFAPIQKTKIDYYNSPEADKLGLIKANVEQTKEIMMENLDKLLERGEKIDILVQKTAVMLSLSTDMKKNATTLHRQMYWRNKKMAIMITLLTIVGIYVLMIFICGGFALKKCF